MASISDTHRKQLADSAISDEAITERGYWTATTKADLERLGFGRAQQNVPALVIPIRDVYGETVLYQARPDTPRIVKGRAVKYETPAGAPLTLDVPARVRDQLANPNVPLWITEGSKKVDSAVAHGLACIGVIGVYGFRHTNGHGGKVAHPALQHIALNGRKVYMAFDSDVMEKPQVYAALAEFSALLRDLKADVLYIYIPTTDGRKMGLDDFLADGGTVADLLATATDTLRRPPVDDVEEEEPDTLPEPSPEALEAGFELLDSPDLLHRADSAAIALGHAGQTFLRMLVYLVLVSRLLARPLNLIITGPSSAGKSFVVNTVCKLFPDYAYYQLAGMSERVLAYTNEPLEHRHLIIGEAAALSHDGPGAMLVRSIVWDGDTRYSYVDKGPEGLHTVVIEKPGPTGLITTTTGTIEPELLTRMLTAHVSDTADTTRTILRATAGVANGRAPEPPDLEPWHAAQWWLQVHGNRDVSVPFAVRLAELVPDHLVRMRRDFTQIITLIQSHALLYQRQRERDAAGRIIADRRDYEAVYALVADIFGAIAAEGVTPVLRKTVETLQRLTPNPTDAISYRRLSAELNIEVSACRNRVANAIKHGWIINLEEKKGRPARIRPGDALPEARTALPYPALLFSDDSVTATPVSAATSPKTFQNAHSDNSVTGDRSEHQPVTCHEPVTSAIVTGFEASTSQNNPTCHAVTPKDTAGLRDTIESDLRRWLADGTLAANRRDATRDDGRPMPAEKLPTFVPIWLADLDNGGAPEQEARRWLVATHEAVTASLAESKAA